MSKTPLTILAIADLHYTGLARQTVQDTNIRGELARTLLRKVFLRVKHLGIKPDLTLLLGDLCENGADPNARYDLLSIRSELARSLIPYIVLPGNHDNPELLRSVFGETATNGLHEFGGYGFLALEDSFDHHHVATRSDAQLRLPESIAAAHHDLPLIALQHCPIYPAIESNYPYRPNNVVRIISGYKKAGVFLSLSGHYHAGQQPHLNDGILYDTLPALCESPFSFSVIKLEGRQAEIENHSLKMTFPNLLDAHSHTEFAYCGTTAEIGQNLALASTLGVATQCVTEHAFQLYFDKKYAMSFAWQSDPEAVAKAWAAPQRNRMVPYTALAKAMRGPNVKIGLEVDLYDNGKLLLAPEDLDGGWDLLVGAIHCIADFKRGVTTQKQAEELFMRDVAALVGYPIQILAHPFRFFVRNGLERPVHLYDELAGLLSDNDVAAEVNFHTYAPDPAFIKACVAKGVRISLGSDAHDVAEVGEFAPHEALLRAAGITPKMYPDVLFSLNKKTL